MLVQQDILEERHREVQEVQLVEVRRLQVQRRGANPVTSPMAMH
jgi:hypothetical protein